MKTLKLSILIGLLALLVGCGGGGASSTNGGTGGIPPFHFTLGSVPAHQSANAFAFSADNAGNIYQLDFTPGAASYAVFVNGVAVAVPNPAGQDLSETSLIQPVLLRGGTMVSNLHHAGHNGSSYDLLHVWTVNGAKNLVSPLNFLGLDCMPDGSKILTTTELSNQYLWLDLDGNTNQEFFFPQYANGHILFVPSKLLVSNSGHAAYSPARPDIDPNFYLLDGTRNFYKTLGNNGVLGYINSNDEIAGTTKDGKWGVYWDTSGKTHVLPKLAGTHLSEVPSGIADDGTIVGTWRSATDSGGILWAKDAHGIYQVYDFSSVMLGLAAGTSVKSVSAISLDGKTIALGVMAAGDSVPSYCDAHR